MRHRDPRSRPGADAPTHMPSCSKRSRARSPASQSTIAFHPTRTGSLTDVLAQRKVAEKKCHESETEAGAATCETTEEPQVREDQHVMRIEILHLVGPHVACRNLTADVLREEGFLGQFLGFDGDVGRDLPDEWYLDPIGFSPG